jgi:2-methylcitrate dehydratase PrpD
MPVFTSTTVISALTNNILNTRFEDLDGTIVENARNRIMDVIGNIIGGTGAPDNTALVDLIKGWGGKKEATILGFGLKAPVHNVAMANCILCNSFDSAPLVVVIGGKRIPSHISGTTVPAAITLGESRGISGKELITTLIAADDFTVRLMSLNKRGRSQTPITALGAAAIAGRLMGMDSFQLKNAFGLALEESAGDPKGLWDGSPTFKTGYGKAARNGIMAAQLAGRGWTGTEDPFFGEYGSFTGPEIENPEILLKDLGQKFYVELVFKPYPGCRLTHVGIDAALSLINNHEFRIADIAEIVLTLNSSAKNNHCWKPFQVREYPMGDALFSYKYSVATTLLNKKAMNENFIEASVQDPAVQSLINKIKLADSPEVEGAELRLTLKNGPIFSESVPVARGDISTPLNRDEMIAKFVAQVEFSGKVDRGNAERLLDLLKNLEKVDNVKEIVELTIK